VHRSTCAREFFAGSGSSVANNSAAVGEIRRLFRVLGRELFANLPRYLRIWRSIHCRRPQVPCGISSYERNAGGEQFAARSPLQNRREYQRLASASAAAGLPGSADHFSQATHANARDRLARRPPRVSKEHPAVTQRQRVALVSVSPSSIKSVKNRGDL